MSFSIYISALAISDTIPLIVGKFTSSIIGDNWQKSSLLQTMVSPFVANAIRNAFLLILGMLEAGSLAQL